MSRPLQIIRIGGRGRSPLRDLYHWLMVIRWWKLAAFTISLFLGANILFAVAYLALGHGIENARPGYFADAFFFSVQTMSTIGYGHLAPVGILANSLATLEAMMGLLGFAMAAGLMFAKFSRPTAKVVFSRAAVISVRDGVPSLAFRMANERSNLILEANLSLVLARDEFTLEGEPIRRLYDLKLARDHSPAFALTWTAVHPIDNHSPLNEETAQSLEAKHAEIIATLNGIDNTFSQVVHARHSYAAADLRWGHRFRDVITFGGEGRRVINYDLFHETVDA